MIGEAGLYSTFPSAQKIDYADKIIRLRGSGANMNCGLMKEDWGRWNITNHRDDGLRRGEEESGETEWI